MMMVTSWAMMKMLINVDGKDRTPAIFHHQTKPLICFTIKPSAVPVKKGSKRFHVGGMDTSTKIPQNTLARCGLP